ncbi:MAG: serine phosphatase RsbU (regulator of sigma subunit) [Flavobacteriales bacterium]|jgi:serine phosphatase RsbU (regulator of sigma subunit)
MKLILLIIFTLFVSFIGAQIAVNKQVVSYPPKVYGYHNQTWQTIQDANGILYFANGDGILIYDGKNWDYVSTETKTNVLAIGIDANQNIYYGGVGEVGQLLKGEQGTYYAKQFVNEKYQDQIELEFFWEVHIFEGQVVFRSLNMWLSYQNDELKVTPANDLKLNESFKIDDELWFQDNSKNLYHRHHDSLQFYSSKDIVKVSSKSLNIKGIFKKDSNHLMIGTYKNGLKIYQPESNTIDHFESDLDQMGVTMESTDMLPNGDIIVLTENSGVVILNPFGKVKSLLNISNGLLSNHMRNSFVDKEGVLWLNSDVGIHKVLLNKNYSLYSSLFEEIKGNPNTIIQKDEILYIGTNEGIYMIYSNFGSSKIKKIDNFNNQVFDLLEVNGDVICAATGGLFILKENQIIPIENSFYSRALAKISNHNMLVGGRNKLGLLQFMDGSWKVTKEIEFPDEFLHIEKDPNQPNVYWGAMYLSGVVKIVVDTALNTVTYKHYDPEIDDHDGYILPFSISDQMIFAPKVEKIFSFDSETESFMDDSLTQKHIKKDFSSWVIKEDIYGNIFYEMSGPIWVLRKNKEGYEVDSTSLFDLDVGYITDIFCGDNGITWLVAEGDLLSFNPLLKQSKTTVFYTLINKVIVNGDSLLLNNYYRTTPEALVSSKFEHEFNNFTFEFVAPQFSYQSESSYSYILEGNDYKYSSWSTDQKAVYTNLSEGKYKFIVKSRNAIGEEGEIAVFEFEVLAPWYRTMWAYIMFTLIGLIVLLMLFKLNSLRLKKSNEKLQLLVEEKTKKISENLNQIFLQKDQLEEFNKDIIDSINYAKRLQQGILPSYLEISQVFKDHFVLYLPKDIVAGDFYWMKEIKDRIIFAVADCTGHGVPGAMVSVVCSNALERSVNEFKLKLPSEILDKTNQLVVDAFNTIGGLETSEELVKDGMDIALISLDPKSLSLTYAGANNPLWIISPRAEINVDFKVVGEEGGLYIHEIKASRRPIGWYDLPDSFQLNSVDLLKGESLYMFTDGYVDQFGAHDGKIRKLKRKYFANIIFSVYNLPMSEQKEKLQDAFIDWKGSQEQIDDVSVFGVKL